MREKWGMSQLWTKQGIRNIGGLKKRYCRNSIALVPTTENKILEPFLLFLCDMLKSRYISELVLDIFFKNILQDIQTPLW